MNNNMKQKKMAFWVKNT